MTTVIGIGIGTSAVRAVAVRAGAVRWAVEVECRQGEELSRAVGELLERAPIRRWPKPGVIVAVGASRAQAKRLVGLPPLTDPKALAQLVREGASCFFLRNGSPLVTSGVRLVEPGTAWAAALEAPLVAELERACHAAKVRLRAVVPTAAVLGAALYPENDRLVWPDGDVALQLTFESGHLAGVRRLAAQASRPGSSVAQGGDGTATEPREPSECTPRPVQPLAALGATAWRFADAYGAAVLPAGEPLALRPGRDALHAAPAPRWRRALAACASIASVTAALIAPGLAATRASHAARARLAQLGTRRTAAIATEREVRLVTSALAQVAAFDSTRTSATFLLRALTKAFPQGSALVTLRVDSTAGTLVALAPRAGAVVTALEHAEGITGPEIIGPVTREAVETRELERVTIRFRIATMHREGAKR